jgi:adenosylhomocysteine/aminodeoxyfutalosine nucleosidase
MFDAHALEMEGASVAVVCNAMNIPFFILRAISDSADMDAGFDFDKFLESSAKVSADFILEMVATIED